ncbi:hypothetical protein Ancab_017483 [Ancistrocladus abbreviatus]
MAADNNTKGCKCLEFARIVLHISSMGMINSLVRIQVDSAIASVRVVEEGTLFDGHEILRGCNKGYPSVLVSRSYIEESLISESLMGYRLSEVKAVDDCQTNYQIGFRRWLVDLSGTLQRGYGEPDDGAVLMMLDSGLPCFSGGDPLDNLRKRFHPEMSEREAANFMIPVCTNAYNKCTTAGYDLIQYLQQGIEK